MRSSRVFCLLVAALVVSFAGAASAATITMTPNPAEVGSIMGNDFNIRLDSGDSITNILNFTAEGAGGTSVAVGALLFHDGVSVLSASDSTGGLMNPDNVVSGLVTPGGAVAGLLVDFGDPSSESFSLQLDGTPTTATLYALNADNIKEFTSNKEFLKNALDRTELRFSTGSSEPGGGPSTAVPEPSAALIFAAGLLVAQAGIRRR